MSVFLTVYCKIHRLYVGIVLPLFFYNTWTLISKTASRHLVKNRGLIVGQTRKIHSDISIPPKKQGVSLRKRQLLLQRTPMSLLFAVELCLLISAVLSQKTTVSEHYTYYTMGQKTAPFYFCSNRMQTIYSETIIGTYIL